MMRTTCRGFLALLLLSLGLLSCRGEPAPGPIETPEELGVRAWPAGPEPEGVGREGRELLRVGPRLVEVEVAAVPEARSRGLGGRRELDENAGMFFIYPRAESRSFWMKDCLMSLDIAYLDDEGRIFQIGSLDPKGPDDSDYPRLPSRAPARYVLEMRKGWFADHGIGRGTETRFSESLRQWESLVIEAEGR
jgi:uncharacterized protein